MERLATKIKLTKALAYPVAMYGCESWTIAKKVESRMNAFEMKCRRRVSWTVTKTNEWVFANAEVEGSLNELIKRR